MEVAKAQTENVAPSDGSIDTAAATAKDAAAANGSNAAAAAPAGALSSADSNTTTGMLPPNNTLYIQNLNERVKVDELKKALYGMFATCGPVLEVQASKRLVTRGQAWVAFKEVADAAKALRDMQNFVFYDKPMHIQFARAKSDVVNELNGVKVDKETRREEAKKRRSTMQTDLAQKRRRVQQQQQQAAAAAASVGPTQAADVAEKVTKEPPNKILFVENLPESITPVALKALFGQYAGYVEARMVPSKPGIAFVEYANESQATIAMAGLQYFQVTVDHSIVVSYARKG